MIWHNLKKKKKKKTAVQMEGGGVCGGWRTRGWMRSRRRRRRRKRKRRLGVAVAEEGWRSKVVEKWTGGAALRSCKSVAFSGGQERAEVVNLHCMKDFYLLIC